MKPTGKIIQQELLNCPYTMRDIATIVGGDTGGFYRLFNGKNLLTVEFALKLEKVLGEGKAEEWLHYQVDYLLWRSKNG